MLVDPEDEHVKSGVTLVHYYFLVSYALNSKIYLVLQNYKFIWMYLYLNIFSNNWIFEKCLEEE